MENKDNIEAPKVSVVVPISEYHHDMRKLYELYANELKNMGKEFEFIFVIDGEFPDAHHDLQTLQNEKKPVKIIKFNHNRGEAAALIEGFQQADGSVILTLASYIQIEPRELTKLFSAYENGNDFIIARRYPRKDPIINRIQSNIYHFLIRILTGSPFKDITSGVRLVNKKIVPDLILYGDLHQFLPVFALHKGLRVKEINVTQRYEDLYLRMVNPGVYLRRLIDILTLFFLVRFTKKPLRFFGVIGSFIVFIGGAITSYLGILRVLGKIELANRPILLLGILLIVSGLQVFSVGLLGELILFTRARKIEQYRIDEIID